MKRIICELKTHIVSLKNEILFLKKRNRNKKAAHFYSNLNATINTKAISSKRAES